MTHREAVAIVGVALALPDADDLDALHRNLLDGRVSVRPPSRDRVHYGGAPEDAEYLAMGYLDRIDLFDHRFFGLSRREAELMDPHHRIALQLAHHAIENACYAPRELRGSNTAVVLTAPEPHYASLYADEDPQQLLGAHPAATAARISYHLDLVGPAQVVDTGCSGSLSAIAAAVDYLRHGQADLAIAGAVSVYPVMVPETERLPVIGLESTDAVCRPFDAEANGATAGEGGGLVVLKRLSDALADGDHIHGVVGGIALNHNGFRATSMSAPSARAQAEVIVEAWRQAGPGPLDYIECHGSGTRLGDVVEAEGLRQAFAEAGRTDPCGISGIKGNVGHLNHAAGIAGLFKVLAALRHGTRYPNPNFTTPNPLIDFTGPVRVDAEATAWRHTEGRPRRAGLSSFGLTGTNVHAVIEEPPHTAPVPDEPTAELVTLSARSLAALAVYMRRVADFLDRTGHRLADVAHAFNRGRDDYPYRWAGIAHDNQELAALLRAGSLAEQEPPGAAPLVLLFSGDGDLGEETWAGLRATFPQLAEVADVAPGARLYARQRAGYQLARALGLTETRLVGCGVGNLVVRTIQDPQAVEEAERAAADAPITSQVNETGLRQAVRDLAGEGAVLVELAADGTLSREISRIAPELPLVRLFADPSRAGVLSALATLYSLGVDIDWSRYYADTVVRRIEVPTYPFDADEVSCWCSPPGGSPSTRPAAAVVPVPTGGDTERQLAEMWTRVLKAEDVGPDANYFMLGGTSIAGITVLRDAEEQFGVHLTFADLHQYSTLRELAARIDTLRAAGQERDDWTITPVPRPGRLPLSYNQEQLWYLDRLQPGTPLYNIPVNTRYAGDFDLDAFRGAVRDVVGRHEILRTRILDEDGRPYALADLPEPHLTFVDLTSAPEEDLGRAITAEARTPFDLAVGPLFRTVVVRLGEQDHVVLHTWHHIVFDGWTPAIFFGELSTCYTSRRTGRPAELPELPVQYADFAAWQRQWLDEERTTRGLEYWREHLRGLDTPELPLDHPRPATQSNRGATVPIALDQDLSRRLREFSVRESTTSFVTMLAVLDAFMYLWAGHKDVVVGAATTGRFNPATHKLVGYFNNLLPFRTKLDPNISFRELVARCAATATGTLDHEEIPFAKIVADLDHRDPSRHPVFTVCYTHQNTASVSLDMAGLEARSLRDDLAGVSGVAPGTSKFDLTFGVYDQDGGPMNGYLEYAVDLFEPATARRLVDLYQNVASAAMDDPDRPLAELLERREPSILAGDRREWTDQRLLSDVFAEHAARRPDEIIVIDADGGHTRQEINQRANRVARRLVEHGVGPDTVVPVLTTRSADMVVGWLAVMKAGGAYATVDPAMPEQRIRGILAGLTAHALVVGEGLAVDCGDHGVPVVRIADAVAGADTDLPCRAGLTNLAYVSHTSGSTGEPHGCEVEHRGLLNAVRWFGEAAGLGAADRIAQMAAPGFDMAVLEVMSALYHGVPLCFVSDILQTPSRLLGELAEHRVTVAGMPTPLVELLLDDLPELPDLALRFVLTGGDLLRVRPPRQTPFALVNAYGTTECSILTTAGQVSVAGPAALPDIGRPVPNNSVYVLNSRLRPVARGEEGEVYLGGMHVGRGYHGRPGVTAVRTVADPFAAEPGARMYRTGDLAAVRPDGTLEFRGRADDQLELRGHRVEPAEVERALLAHPRVREALVLAEQQPSGAPLLVAHVAGEDTPDEAELTTWVSRVLPVHMVPGRVLRHAELPRTSNGKQDRRTLREKEMLHYDGTLTQAVTPGAVVDGAEREAERILGEIWTELLGIERVTPSDNFFQIGGDSLLSVGVASRAARAGLQVTPHDVLSNPTLRELAAVAVKDAVPTPVHAAAVTAPSEPIPPSPLVHAVLTNAPDGGRSFISPIVLETTPGIRADAVRAAFARLVELHEPLRYRFRHNSLGWRVECAERETAPVVDATVLPPLDEAQLHAYLTADLGELLADVDLGRGPVLRARFYDRGADRPGLILLAIHHFVYDATSFVPLIEDLDAAFAGQAPTTRRAAWREWTHLLRAMANSDEVAGELPYWKWILNQAAEAEPVAENGIEGTRAGLVRRTIEAGRVAPRLTESGPTGQHAAMAAVAVAWSRWRGTPDAFMSTVGMGTSPNPLWNGDRTGSIGWFTHMFPVFLPVASGDTVADTLPRAAAALRSVPNDGIGYGVLRHLSPDTPDVTRLRALPEPSLLVEHLANANDGFARFGGASVRARPMVIPTVPDSMLARVPVVVETHVMGGALELGVVHRGSVAGADMESFADHLVEAFIELDH